MLSSAPFKVKPHSEFYKTLVVLKIYLVLIIILSQFGFCQILCCHTMCLSQVQFYYNLIFKSIVLIHFTFSPSFNISIFFLFEFGHQKDLSHFLADPVQPGCSTIICLITLFLQIFKKSLQGEIGILIKIHFNQG